MNKYGFLYYLNNTKQEHYKIIKTKSIYYACNKISRYFKKLVNRIKLDYEVDFKSTYIDITDIKSINEYLA